MVIEADTASAETLAKVADALQSKKVKEDAAGSDNEIVLGLLSGAISTPLGPIALASPQFSLAGTGEIFQVSNP